MQFKELQAPVAPASTRNSSSRYEKVPSIKRNAENVIFLRKWQKVKANQGQVLAESRNMSNGRRHFDQQEPSNDDVFNEENKSVPGEKVQKMVPGQQTSIGTEITKGHVRKKDGDMKKEIKCFEHRRPSKSRKPIRQTSLRMKQSM